MTDSRDSDLLKLVENAARLLITVSELKGKPFCITAAGVGFNPYYSNAIALGLAGTTEEIERVRHLVHEIQEQRQQQEET